MKNVKLLQKYSYQLVQLDTMEAVIARYSPKTVKEAKGFFLSFVKTGKIQLYRLRKVAQESVRYELGLF